MKFWRKKDEKVMNAEEAKDGPRDVGVEIPDDLLDRISGGNNTKTSECHPCINAA